MTLYGTYNIMYGLYDDTWTLPLSRRVRRRIPCSHPSRRLPLEVRLPYLRADDFRFHFQAICWDCELETRDPRVSRGRFRYFRYTSTPTTTSTTTTTTIIILLPLHIHTYNNINNKHNNNKATTSVTHSHLQQKQQQQQQQYYYYFR